jgi:hypothetical protein
VSVEKHRLQGIGAFPVGVAGCRGRAGIFARGADRQRRGRSNRRESPCKSAEPYVQALWPSRSKRAIKSGESFLNNYLVSPKVMRSTNGIVLIK